MLQFCFRCLLFQVDNLNLASNLENYFYAMLTTCKCMPFYKKLDFDTKSEPLYLATTLWRTQSLHIRRIFNTCKKYGLSLVDQAQNSDKKRRRVKFTRYRFSKNISTQYPCWMFAWGVGNDLSCFIGFVQSFKASLTIMFAIQSIKECTIILLLSYMLYDEWKKILLLWE
jgi:hypothetical protein